VTPRDDSSAGPAAGPHLWGEKNKGGTFFMVEKSDLVWIQLLEVQVLIQKRAVLSEDDVKYIIYPPENGQKSNRPRGVQINVYLVKWWVKNPGPQYFYGFVDGDPSMMVLMVIRSSSPLNSSENGKPFQVKQSPSSGPSMPIFTNI
jgi:hypothetical protein